MLLKRIIKKIINRVCKSIYGEDAPIIQLLNGTNQDNLFYNKNVLYSSIVDNYTKLYSPYKISESIIGNYTYIAQNSIINHTTIGNFCSIGPNLLCGWGIHPTNGLSTSPMFYSTKKQNGITLSANDKIDEIKPILIGNDVFIGMNVTILDGITIGDGAIIGAGSVVSKNIPAYAIAVGSPIKIIKYRFEKDTIQELLNIKWWEWSEEKLQSIEEHFFSVDTFISQYKK